VKHRGRWWAEPRLWVWAAGTILCLCYYFVNALQPPHRTPAGVERWLFGLGGLAVKLMEAPAGGQWVLVPDEETLQGARSPSIPPPILWQRAQRFEWAPQAAPPRRLAPFRPTGTWRLEGSSLRRVWNRTAKGWLDDHQLWAGENGYLDLWILDLNRRRARRGTERSWSHVEEWFYGQDDMSLLPVDQRHSELSSTLSSALEELPSDFVRGWESMPIRCGERGLYLAYTTGVPDEHQALYAVSDELMPRILPLARNAWPQALSRDGRTLFFRRDGSLWRMDFRKPLPALLDKVSVPELPNPSFNGTEE
jgi:hypothetical protein